MICLEIQGKDSLFLTHNVICGANASKFMFFDYLYPKTQKGGINKDTALSDVGFVGIIRPRRRCLALFGTRLSAL
jgi:hypothetical protein